MPQGEASRRLVGDINIRETSKRSSLGLDRVTRALSLLGWGAGAMTEAPGRIEDRPVQVPAKTTSVASLINSSIKPGSGVFLPFNDGVMNVVLDKLGDWTISVTLSTMSLRIAAMGGLLERLGYFGATEVDGRVYYLWTSALEGQLEKRERAEETLLETLKVLESRSSPQYIS
jgi:hypothetical protein